ncbi:hypothetical protein AB0D08_25805 [Kitasatospora sp. NPDC048540]|uniref:hypothetical protein n=1 Tax=unclassified Kitasatospora TaxID=2633591 RepID=UPI000539C343|nr:hypothetical protein [Kitasatospora sp. MBT63]
MTMNWPDRAFHLWWCSATHTTLRLQSNPTFAQGAPATRIEIQFGHVRSLFIRPVADGLTVVRATPQEGAGICSRYSLDPAWADSVFLLRSTWEGFIVSSAPSWREAVRDIDDPSLFTPVEDAAELADVTFGHA